SGGDLLSPVLRRSTIGVSALNCRVRAGIGCFAPTVTTRPDKDRKGKTSVMLSVRSMLLNRAFPGSDQANRAISTSQLHALPHFNLWPIDVVVFHGPNGEILF